MALPPEKLRLTDLIQLIPLNKYIERIAQKHWVLNYRHWQFHL